MWLYPNVHVYEEKYLKISFFVECREYYEEFVYYNTTSDSEIFWKSGDKTRCLDQSDRVKCSCLQAEKENTRNIKLKI